MEMAEILAVELFDHIHMVGIAWKTEDGKRHGVRFKIPKETIKILKMAGVC
jgi:hypothetical protein